MSMKLPGFLKSSPLRGDGAGKGLTAISLLLLFSGLIAVWVKSPLQIEIRGIDLLTRSGELLRLPMFGILLIAFAVMLPLYFISKQPLIKGAIGFLPLWFAISFLIKMTFFNYAILDRLIDQNQQYVSMIKFSYHYLPLNYGIEPLVIRKLSTETLLDRITTGWYFLSWGWYLFSMGGVLLCFITLTRLIKMKIEARRLFLIPLFFSGSLLILLSPAILSQYHMEKGDRYFARGLYEKTASEYQKARRVYPQVERREDFHELLGKVYYHLNAKYQPEFYLYTGDLLLEQRRATEAEFAYQMAIKVGAGKAREMAGKRLAWLYIEKGIREYKLGGVGNAVSLWKEAIQVDPEQMQAHYYLARGYYDLGQYDLAILENQRILQSSMTPLLSANVNANIGDCYYKLRDYSKAREYYQTSMELDRDNNFRIFKSLGGT